MKDFVCGRPENETLLRAELDLLPDQSGAGLVFATEHQHHADSGRGKGYHQGKVQGFCQRERRLRRCKAGVGITPNRKRQSLVLQRDDVRLLAVMGKTSAKRRLAAASDDTLKSLDRADKFTLAHEGRTDGAEREAALLGARILRPDARIAARQAPALDRVGCGRKGNAIAHERS